MMSDIRCRRCDCLSLTINAIEQQAVKSLRKAKALGVTTIIDATPINLGRDIDLLRRVSQRSEVNTIASTGFYFHESPWFDHTNYCIDRAVDILEKECIEGINGTDIKPGIIKCATEAPELSPMNKALHFVLQPDSTRAPGFLL